MEATSAMGRTPDPRVAAEEAGTVRKVTGEDHEPVANALARAFYDDPVLTWFFPDDARRMGQLERLFLYFGKRAWYPQDESYTTGQVAGGALWMKPDQWRVGILDQIRMMPGFVSSIGWRDLPRSLRGFNLMESKHPHDSHYYLPVIGVDPAWQGKGLGTALLRPMLDKCDSERAPAYLEATTPRNRTCYERNGFEVTGEITLPDGPTMFAMWRKPAATEASTL